MLCTLSVYVMYLDVCMRGMYVCTLCTLCVYVCKLCAYVMYVCMCLCVHMWYACSAGHAYVCECVYFILRL